MNKYALVIDVESVGLQGEHFSVGGVVIDLAATEYKELDSFEFSCKPEYASGRAADLEWVKENVTILDINCDNPQQVMDKFWERWIYCTSVFPSIKMYADCLWPVEARFIIACIDRDPNGRNWEGPYPFCEISSFITAAGWDPMANFPRFDCELPKHASLPDARQSARILFESVKRIDYLHSEIRKTESGFDRSLANPASRVIS